MMEEISKQVVFRETLSPLESILVEENIPVTGKIEEITAHYPEGCDALVDLALKVDGFRVWPSMGFVALNNATPVMRILYPIIKGHTLQCEVENHDSENSHTPSLVVTMVGVK